MKKYIRKECVNMGKNRAYDEIDVSEDVKNRFYYNCLNYAEKVEVGLDDENVVSTVFETKQKERSSLLDKFIKCAAVACVVGVIGFLGSKGLNYFGQEKTNVSPAKEITTKNQKEDDEFAVEYTRDALIAVYEFIFHDKQEVLYDSKFEKLCYDKKGKLKEGYEEREFFVDMPDGSKLSRKYVGRDFVYIERKEANKNACSRSELIYSMTPDDSMEKVKMSCNEIENDFSKYDYVYFLQGDYLVRVKLDTEFTTWMDKTSKYSNITKIDDKLIVYKRAPENTKIDTNDVVDFFDANMYPSAEYKIINTANKKEIKKFNATHLAICIQRDMLVAYFVDEKHNIWRIKDVDVYHNDLEKIPVSIAEEYMGDAVNYQKQIFGVNENYKIEKIAEGSYFYNSADDTNLVDEILAYRDDDTKILKADEYIDYSFFKDEFALSE